MEISTVRYGKSTLPENMIFAGGSKERKRDIVFNIFLIKTNGKIILVDAGCETMPGFVMEDFIGPVKALANIGINAEDITDVVITHSHHDHIECVGHYKNAVIHIEDGEFEAGKSFIPENLRVNIFSDTFEVCDGVKIIRIGGHTKGSCIVEIIKENKTFIISGDECYLRECLTKKVPTGCSQDPEASRAFVEKYSGSKYTVLLCHDGEEATI